MLCMSKTSKMVFVAFMQHCIQSTVTHLTNVEGVEDVKYYVLCIQWSLVPPRGRLFVIRKAFHLVGSAIHHQSV